MDLKQGRGGRAVAAEFLYDVVRGFAGEEADGRAQGNPEKDETTHGKRISPREGSGNNKDNIARYGIFKLDIRLRVAFPRERIFVEGG